MNKKVLLDNNQIPLHYQIAEYIIIMLKRGELSPEQKLPPEEKLKDIFGVSRTTVRHALEHLLRKRLLYKKQGKGTFWTEEAASLVQYKKQAGINREIFNITERTTVKSVIKNTKAASEQVAEFLKVTPGNDIWEFTRIRCLDDEPISLTINYLQQKYGAAIEERDLLDMTMLEALEKVAHVALGTIEHEVEIARANSEIASVLSIAVLDPILAVKTCVYDIDKEPVEIVWTYFVENKYKFRVVLDK